MQTQEAYEQMRDWFTRPDAQLSGTKMKLTTAGYVACKYRLNGTPEDPARCAVGCLIPDSLYQPEMDDLEVMGDGTDVHELASTFDSIAELFADADLDFLAQAQNAHDRAVDREETPVDFVEALDEIAESFGLAVRR